MAFKELWEHEEKDIWWHKIKLKALYLADTGLLDEGITWLTLSSRWTSESKVHTIQKTRFHLDITRLDVGMKIAVLLK